MAAIASKRSRIPAIVIAVIVILAVAAFLVMKYGNPQWHPQLYIHQAAGIPDRTLSPGPNYTGQWNNWDQDGNLASVYRYADGKRDGAYTVFTPAGGILSEGQYKNGELDGLQIVQQESGARTEIPYVAGKRHGVEKTLYAGGAVAVEAPWVDGEQDGSVNFYYENGSIQSSIPFYRGKREGVMKTFYDNGRPQGDENYRDDKLNGASDFWHPDGTPDMSLTYRDDTMDGVQIWYFPGGKKYREIVMSMGQPNGPWKEWDEAGNLVVDEEYDMGELKRKPGEKKEDAPSENGV